ncbi:MAG: hypothetical protein IGS38_15435 [Synechococcales cyanobacterium M58_A2018_015]|nr:hypothetical protein [Synechococcales cyanobacterium M58_A2018_015]
MNSQRLTTLLVALITGSSVALGQTLLLSWLFPKTIAVYGLWILLGLLVLNCGGAAIVLFCWRIE